MNLDNFTTSPVPFIFPSVQIDANEAMRNLRNEKLKTDVDSVNPVRYETLTEEQRQELRTYRQALLDLPQQATWPRNVVWPTKPTWL